MKRLNIILVCLVVILSVVLALKIFKDKTLDNNTDENTTEATTQVELTTENKNTYKTEIEKKVNEEIEKLENENIEYWKKAYIEFLNNYDSVTESDRIYLGYVDDNDVPELFISKGTSHFCMVEIYTFNNNLVTYLCTTGSFGSVNYFEREGIICSHYMGMGVGNYHVYNLNDGKIEEIYDAFTNENFSGDDEKFEIEISINDIDVSSEEMNEFLNYYFSEENSTWIFDEFISNNIGYELKESIYTKYINNF